MPSPQPTGHGTVHPHTSDRQPEQWGIAEVIAEGEALRMVLQDASARSARLLTALRHKRRQGRAMQAAMASLKQLQLDP